MRSAMPSASRCASKTEACLESPRAIQEARPNRGIVYGENPSREILLAPHSRLCGIRTALRVSCDTRTFGILLFENAKDDIDERRQIRSAFRYRRIGCGPAQRGRRFTSRGTECDRHPEGLR